MRSSGLEALPRLCPDARLLGARRALHMEGFEGLSNGDVSKGERLAQVREQRLHDAFAGCVLLLPDRTG